MDEVLESVIKDILNHVKFNSWKVASLAIFPRSLPCREILKVSQEVTHTEASARCFAGVCRSDAFLGCSDAAKESQFVMWRIIF